MADPSPERIRELLDYDRETGIFRRRIARQGRNGKVGDVVGYEQRYRRIIIDRKSHAAHRLAWIIVNGPIPEGLQIDHKNGIKTDNRICNLRLANGWQQHRNHSRQRNNKSGRTGICWQKRGRSWRVYLGRIYLGCHKDFQKACEIRAAAEQIYGEFRPREEVA
jgi:hypothetical protein